MLAGMLAEKMRLSGIECIHYANPTKDPVAVVIKEQPDLILTGVVMPVMDGYSAAELIKADARTKKIPLVFLTNHGQKKDIDRGMHLGAVGYLVKAHHAPSEVIDTIQKLVRTNNQRSNIHKPMNHRRYIVVVLLAAITFGVWWYSIRPSSIRATCSNKAMYEVRESCAGGSDIDFCVRWDLRQGGLYKNMYDACLHSEGLQ